MRLARPSALPSGNARGVTDCAQTYGKSGFLEIMGTVVVDGTIRALLIPPWPVCSGPNPNRIIRLSDTDFTRDDGPNDQRRRGV